MTNNHETGIRERRDVGIICKREEGEEGTGIGVIVTVWEGGIYLRTDASHESSGRGERDDRCWTARISTLQLARFLN
jgi:pantoate kinase